ncbi:hemerythrin domain-containing protein [Chelativorans petroleitrophicus]|uniref:hemerythrin domain-containing protein n=1 Tax=Chelativorans petroleitrophicus TaxID=2975484 RepID=UPI00311AFADC
MTWPPINAPYESCPFASRCAAQRCLLCKGSNAHFWIKLDLCTALEAIADSLPSLVDRAQCLWMAETLLPALQMAHAFEEDVVYPAFCKEAAFRVEGQRTLARLRVEHVEDEALAEEISERLFFIGHGAGVENPEALGFMLRTFFRSVRRHVAFEREHVLPLAGGWPMPNLQPGQPGGPGSEQ